MKLSVFYFDDQVVLLDIFRDMFASDYEVSTASGLTEARRVLGECSPDVIISDLSMPEISGIEFLREAAQVCPRSVRVMVTGFAQVGDLLAEIGEGIIQFFAPKPWKEEQMRDVLTRAAALLEVIRRKENA